MSTMKSSKWRWVLTQQACGRWDALFITQFMIFTSIFCIKCLVWLLFQVLCYFQILAWLQKLHFLLGVFSRYHNPKRYTTFPIFIYLFWTKDAMIWEMKFCFPDNNKKWGSILCIVWANVICIFFFLYILIQNLITIHGGLLYKLQQVKRKQVHVCNLLEVTCFALLHLSNWQLDLHTVEGKPEAWGRQGLTLGLISWI